MNEASQAAVLSSDRELVQVLGDALGDAHRVLNCPTSSGMRRLLQTHRPVALVVDARQDVSGGHALVTFLDDLTGGHPDMTVLLLTHADCPEPLERRATLGQVPHFRGAAGVADLVAALKQQLVAAEPPPFQPQPASEETFVEGVLEGVTRRFETNSVQLKHMLEDLSIAAAHDVTILLIGETGSGKTFLSRLIHEASPRRNEPFLHVACGALPRELIESELFGHTKGSFTSAHADKEGKFVAAQRGTILLDEIDVLGPEQQVKLLRVIETGEFEPVGSNATLRLQARLVVASNLDLQPLVDVGRFRPDLYYRLNMLKFEIPPLRRRRMDIVPLAKQFIRKFQQRHGTAIHLIEEDVLAALAAYPWPGNVRELENVIQRAVIYCRDGVLSTRQLPQHILTGVAGPTNDPSVSLTVQGITGDHSLGRQIALTEREIIEQALFQNEYSKTRTARALGISRVTLYNKLKKYDMTK
jgi:DNA-binding NtrC family response regulator